MLNPGVTLPQVWDALCDCAEVHGIELSMLPDAETGFIELVKSDNVVQVFDDLSLIHI